MCLVAVTWIFTRLYLERTVQTPGLYAYWLWRIVFGVLCYLVSFQALRRERPTPVLTAHDDFAAAIACIVICFVRMARLPSPQLGLLLDGLTSYPLPCLTLPVRWGSSEPICQWTMFFCTCRPIRYGCSRFSASFVCWCKVNSFIVISQYLGNKYIYY